MLITNFAAALTILAGVQSAEPARIVGTLAERPVPETGMVGIELKLSEDRSLPGATAEDKVYRARPLQFRAVGQGLEIAWVEAANGKSYLFVDTNFDGRLTESERHERPGGTGPGAPPLELELTVAPGLALPFRCNPVALRDPNDDGRRMVMFTAMYRVEGHADIGGRKTLVSLPYNVARNLIDLRQGRLGVDSNGDGTIDMRGFTGPEVMVARGDRVLFKVGDRFVSFESADLAARRFVLREHAAAEYTTVTIEKGSPLPDFTFTDFDGKTRKLSDFRGKYLLIDVWGSWCKPCVEDFPKLKAAYERFAGEKFEILGLDYEHGASDEKVRALLQEKGVRWPNALPATVKELIHDRWRIMAFPTLLLLDPNGVVIETSRALRGTQLTATLERLLPR
jgi:thiol-disulfide isomerase/thioredoxin